MKSRYKTWAKDSYIALGLNVIFFVIFLCLFQIHFETNDDNAMALMAEGAYGGYTSHLVFENLIWGKVVNVLAGLFPAVKWYLVLQYGMIFMAFTFVSYIFIRLQGRKAGLVSSLFLLMVFGYQTYVVFQWTRTAAVTTIGGIIILAFGLEKARKRWEKLVFLTVGALLCIFGSMIRFQFFMVCAVLTGGIILIRFWEIFRKKPEGWKRRLGSYLLVFGAVACGSVVIFGADRLYYQKNEEWKYYLEYNQLRADLWDRGFPDYEENRDLYESLGISESDMQYYHCWNMDTELLPAETLQKLVEAKKEQKGITAEMIKNYFKEYPAQFLSMPLFAFFLMLSLIAIALNKRNLYFVAYEFVAVMAFEFYFFVINRYGLPRIDAGMWMSSIAVVLYGMSEDIGKIQVKSRKWIAVLCGVVLAMNLSTFHENRELEEISTDLSRNFFELVSGDEEKLYIFSMHSEPFKLETSYDFWEPARLGDAANVYYMGGWEFNVPVMEHMLRRYNVDNIYRDSINNGNVLIVADSDAELMQNYIKENYDETANLIFLKDIDGAKIWRIRNKKVELQKKIDMAAKDIKSDINVEIADGELSVSGYAYKENSNSFQQYAFIKIEDSRSGEIFYADLPMSNLEGCEDVMNGKYSAISGNMRVDTDNNCKVSVILQTDGKLYEVFTSAVDNQRSDIDI